MQGERELGVIRWGVECNQSFFRYLLTHNSANTPFRRELSDKRPFLILICLSLKFHLNLIDRTVDTVCRVKMEADAVKLPCRKMAKI